MRNLSQLLRSHLNGEITTLATCWKLTRTDGKIFTFTDHDKSLVIDDIKYDSIAGFTPTNVESNSNMAVDNLDLAGQFHDNKITHTDLLAGKYEIMSYQIAVKLFKSVECLAKLL